MNLKVTVLLLIALGLSACNTLRKPPPETQASVVIDEPQEQQTTIIDDTATVEPIATPKVVVQSDLIERLRRGFRFPELESPYIKNYQKWSTEHPKYLTNLLTRAEPYLYYIVEEIEKRGLPTELALLPAIESAYKPHATSRSGASGLWQFIPSTGKSFGLRQDWWYDGRRDVLLATNAALDYLTQINKQFDGDWFLTLAAYNAGPGTINRAIKKNKRKHKGTTYQKLKLRDETRRYIPKLQALKNIIKNPERFGINLKSIPNQPYFEVVQIPGQIDLHQFANESGISMTELRHLNAGLLRWASPAQGPHRLLMPLSNHERTAQALKVITANPQIEYRRHTIAQGDTLSGIAERYSVSVSALRTTNKLRGSSIRAGKTLMIPVPHRVTANNSSKHATNSGSSNDKNKLVHRVVKGDTLWSIARRYQVQVKQLLDWNQLAANQILSLNQALLIFR